MSPSLFVPSVPCVPCVPQCYSEVPCVPLCYPVEPCVPLYYIVSPASPWVPSVLFCLVSPVPLVYPVSPCVPSVPLCPVSPCVYCVPLCLPVSRVPLCLLWPLVSFCVLLCLVSSVSLVFPVSLFPTFLLCPSCPLKYMAALPLFLLLRKIFDGFHCFHVPSCGVFFARPGGQRMWFFMKIKNQNTKSASKLFSIIKSHLPSAHSYADDTQLYLSFRPLESTCEAEALVVSFPT